MEEGGEGGKDGPVVVWCCQWDRLSCDAKTISRKNKSKIPGYYKIFILDFVCEVEIIKKKAHTSNDIQVVGIYASEKGCALPSLPFHHVVESKHAYQRKA
jgi:hypothetical protein